ncbi:GNAT family N-acetyltransferase [Maribacter algicola]|uniref:GNAT family N-acetyltransferase n=1 Tax=Meishania litoralis TaxID=3434685 RepID=A0ACC7LLE7_9FLAO
MISINKAHFKDAKILALLGTVTYTESHGHFIDNEKDLMKYNESAFSVLQTKKEISDTKNIFFIISKDDLPIGYAKLVFNSSHKNVDSQNSCQLERIYILNDFIPLKVGQQFLTFLERKAKEFKANSIWLSVHRNNIRAIKFYQRNEYKDVGKSTFFVNGKEYENEVFSKEI